MEITITTKAGKFVMKGEEVARDFMNYLNDKDLQPAASPGIAASRFLDFLSTYEEEVKTEKYD